jgi:hypothetical protein
VLRFDRFRALAAGLLLLLVLRLFKGLRIHPRLGLIAGALGRAAGKAAPFLWLFGAVYCVFAVVGHA